MLEIIVHGVGNFLLYAKFEDGISFIVSTTVSESILAGCSCTNLSCAVAKSCLVLQRHILRTTRFASSVVWSCGL
jgi:hypothetical protein